MGAGLPGNNIDERNAVMPRGPGVVSGHGFGSELFVGFIGGERPPRGRLAYYDTAATKWVELGGGTNGPVRALALHDGKLYIGGRFSYAGATYAVNLASWDGANFEALASGLHELGDLHGGVHALASFNSELWIGGSFFRNFLGLFTWNGSRYLWKYDLFGGQGQPPLGSVWSLSVVGTDIWAGVGGYYSQGSGVTPPGASTGYAAYDAAGDFDRYVDFGVGFSPVLAAVTYNARDVFAASHIHNLLAQGYYVFDDDNFRNNPDDGVQLSGGVDGPVRDLMVDGANLVLAGDFQSAHNHGADQSGGPFHPTRAASVANATADIVLDPRPFDDGGVGISPWYLIQTKAVSGVVYAIGQDTTLSANYVFRRDASEWTPLLGGGFQQTPVVPGVILDWNGTLVVSEGGSTHWWDGGAWVRLLGPSPDFLSKGSALAWFFNNEITTLQVPTSGWYWNGSTWINLGWNISGAAVTAQTSNYVYLGGLISTVNGEGGYRGIARTEDNRTFENLPELIDDNTPSDQFPEVHAMTVNGLDLYVLWGPHRVSKFAELTGKWSHYEISFSSGQAGAPNDFYGGNHHLAVFDDHLFIAGDFTSGGIRPRLNGLAKVPLSALT